MNGKSLIVKGLNFMSFILQKAHRPITDTAVRMFSATLLLIIRLSKLKQMQIMCLVQGCSILMLGFEPPDSASRYRHSNHMTN